MAIKINYCVRMRTVCLRLRLFCDFGALYERNMAADGEDVSMGDGSLGMFQLF